MPYDSVWKIAWQALRFHPYRITGTCYMTGTKGSLKLLHFKFLLKRWFTQHGLRTFWEVICLWHILTSLAKLISISSIFVSVNPHVLKKQPLYPEKWQYSVILPLPLTLDKHVFKQVISNGIQSSYFKEQQYHNMVSYFVIPTFLLSECLQDIIFIQDHSPPHINHRLNRFIIMNFTE